MTQRTVTLHDVARIAGVSASTASRVLNGGAPVSEALRLRVLAVANSLGYVSNQAAQALRGRRTILFVLVSDPRTFPIATQAAAIEAEARTQGVVASVVMVGGEAAARVQTIRTLRSLRPAALIVAYTEPHGEVVRPELTAYRDEGGRVVVLGNTSPGFAGFPSVSHDDRASVTSLAEHLAGLGRRRPAIVTVPSSPLLEYRRQVMLDTLATYGTDPATVPVAPADLTSAGARAATRRLLADAVPPDLIYATNDVLALGVLDALHDAGVPVPDVIAVAGHDDIPLAADATPGLTTVALDFAGAGQAGLRLALTDDPQDVVLPGRLVVRGSTVRTQ